MKKWPVRPKYHSPGRSDSGGLGNRNLTHSSPVRAAFSTKCRPYRARNYFCLNSQASANAPTWAMIFRSFRAMGFMLLYDISDLSLGCSRELRSIFHSLVRTACFRPKCRPYEAVKNGRRPLECCEFIRRS